MVEKSQKSGGDHFTVHEGKKMVEKGDVWNQMLLLPSLILDTCMRIAANTSWILKTGNCYRHEEW